MFKYPFLPDMTEKLLTATLKLNTNKQKPLTESIHHADKFVQYVPPLTPLLYCKSGVYRGIQFFFFSAPKHGLSESYITSGPGQVPRPPLGLGAVFTSNKCIVGSLTKPRNCTFFKKSFFHMARFKTFKFSL